MSGRILANAPAPGSPEWFRTMSASKIAAVVGKSPYESRFSLYHRMSGTLPELDELTVEPDRCAGARDCNAFALTLDGFCGAHAQYEVA